MHPKFTAVTSSNIEGYCYLRDRALLLIEFKSGGVYAYENVPDGIPDLFANAASHGKFFQEHIKDDFTATKLDEFAVASVCGAATATPRPQRNRVPLASLEGLLQRHPQLAVVF